VIQFCHCFVYNINTLLFPRSVLYLVVCIFTGNIARSATRRYLSYSEADFEVFWPAREIWYGGGDRRSPHPCQISPQSVPRLGYRTPKLKFLLRFDQNVEYKRPTGAYPLRDFHKSCRVGTPFQDALAVKISLDLLQGLWSYGCFK